MRPESSADRLAEEAILKFLREHAGMRFTTSEVGQEVRPLVITRGLHGRGICEEPRIIMGWASVRLNALHRKGSIQKGEVPPVVGTYKPGKSFYGLRPCKPSVLWWIEAK